MNDALIIFDCQESSPFLACDEFIKLDTVSSFIDNAFHADTQSFSRPVLVRIAFHWRFTLQIQKH